MRANRKKRTRPTAVGRAVPDTPAARSRSRKVGHVRARWHPEMAASDALAQIAAAQTSVMLANEPRVRAAVDVAALHDMRVACRRLREAVRLFAGILRPATARVLMRELKWLSAALGAARDVDVACRELRRLREGLTSKERHQLQAYIDWLVERRAGDRRRMLRVLTSRRFQQLQARLLALSGGAPGLMQSGSPPLDAYVQPALDRLRARVLRDGMRLGPSAGDAALHRLRIRCKRLRYAYEFLAPAYGEHLRRQAGNVKRVQDLLGDHQDTVVALTCLHHDMGELCDHAHTGIDLSALLRLERLLRKRYRALRRRYAGVWQRFASRHLAGRAE